jgi:molybdate transport system substrate-binding protein
MMIPPIPMPIIPSDHKEDLHNLEYATGTKADLVLFMAGNQFMVMETLLTAFQQQYPHIRRIFYETLPPGLELKQILAGGALFKDEILSIRPDIYTSVNEKAMQTLEHHRMIDRGAYHLYLHNRIVLMVPAGNPLGVNSVTGLGRANIRVSQPDPENEDIAYHIMNMYRDAGGKALVDRIMKEKHHQGTTLYTVVHHRETPDRIISGVADVGPVWATEVIYAQDQGIAVDLVELGEEYDQRQKINYYACRMNAAANRTNADLFLAFITGTEAASIYRKFGFSTHDGS